jgi:hypothetical protein
LESGHGTGTVRDAWRTEGGDPEIGTVREVEGKTARPPWAGEPLSCKFLQFGEFSIELPLRKIAVWLVGSGIDQAGKDQAGSSISTGQGGIPRCECIRGCISVGGIARACRIFQEGVSTECIGPIGCRNCICMHVHISAHRLLRVTDIEDAAGTVGTLLPGAGADEEDGDEGEQDEDDDRQFEEGHTCVALVGLDVGQFHGVFVFYSTLGCVCIVFCQREKAAVDLRFLRSQQIRGILGEGRKWEK